MILRFGLLAVLATAIVADRRFLLDISLPSDSLLMWAGGLAMGFLGSLLTRNSASKAHVLWRNFWLLLLAAVWLSVVIPAVLDLLRSLAGFGPVAIRRLRPYALATSLLFGYLWLVSGRSAERSAQGLPLTMALPLVLAPLLLVNPSGEHLPYLPLLAASGMVPWSSTLSPDEESPWIEAAASVLEMAALQTVAWALILAVLGFFAEGVRWALPSALFVGSTTGIAGWILSGLVWGASASLRKGRGRQLVLALSRLLFGRPARQSLTNGSEQIVASLEGPENDEGDVVLDVSLS